MNNKLPWKNQTSPYVTCGPKQQVSFEIHGIPFVVTPTDAKGRDTGRTRFKVDCIECDCILHPATTGPSSHVEGHMKENHGMSRTESIAYE